MRFAAILSQGPVAARLFALRIALQQRARRGAWPIRPADREPVRAAARLPAAGRLRARRRHVALLRRARSSATGCLTEYFAFPQKFLFFDLAGLGRPHARRRRAINWKSSSISTAPPSTWSRTSPPTRSSSAARRSSTSIKQRAEPIALTHDANRISRCARRPAAVGPRGLLDRPRDGRLADRRAGRISAVLFVQACRRTSGADDVLACRAAAGRQGGRLGATKAPKSSCRWSISDSTPSARGRLDARRGNHLPEPRPAPPAAVRPTGHVGASA